MKNCFKFVYPKHSFWFQPEFRHKNRAPTCFLNSSRTFEKSFWFSFLFWEFLVFNWKKKTLSVCERLTVILSMYFFLLVDFQLIYMLFEFLFFGGGVSFAQSSKEEGKKIWRFLESGCFLHRRTKKCGRDRLSYSWHSYAPITHREHTQIYTHIHTPPPNQITSL